MKAFSLTLFCFTLIAPLANGIVTVLSTGYFNEPNLDTPGIESRTIDVGADADLLIIGVGAEIGPPGSTMLATYGGNFLTLATGNFNSSSIFYLDLTQSNYTGGDAILSIFWNHTAGGSLGVSWVAIDDDLGPGESFELQSTASIRQGSDSIDLVTEVDDTFNFVHFTANETGGAATITLSDSLTEVHTIPDAGSARHASGYELNVNAGTSTYSWNVSTGGYRQIDAVAFAVVPEPTSLGLIMGVLILGLVKRWRTRSSA